MTAPGGRSTLLAILCVTVVALVGVFSIGVFDLNGSTMTWIIGSAIVAIAGLGGYEIREQLRKQ